MRKMCREQVTNRKRRKDLMLMSCLNETIDQLAVANSLHWHGDVLMREEGDVLRREDWEC